MSLVLNEEERHLKNSARDFLNKHACIKHFRQLRTLTNTSDYDQQLWEKMVELGWSAITIPHTYDGLNFGFTGLGQIFEEMGKNLSHSSLFSSLVLSASAIELLGSEEHKQTYLKDIANGKLTCAFAHEESNRHNAGIQVTTQAKQQQQQFVISGKKTLVFNLANANKILVSATLIDQQNSTGLFVLDSNQQGITQEHVTLLDGSCASILTFENTISETSLNNNISNDDFEQLLDRARIILAAEMLGGCLEVFQRTMDYIKEREQFGVKIGSFQALKHRAAKMFIELELCKSVVLAALRSLDHIHSAADNKHAVQHSRELASLAKALLNETYILICDEATQMHGGIGVTDELDIGLFLKRARIYKQLLGDTNFHRQRYADLLNF